MAEPDNKRTFSEDEHLAIVADRVTTETAELRESKAALETEKSDLETKLDVEITAKEAEKARADKAEKDLADYKAEVEQREAAAERKDERISAVKEAAPHLKDEFFDEEKRVARIVAMEDEAFEEYVADLKAVAPAPGANKDDIPRETAMKGDPAGKGGTPSAAQQVLFRGRLRAVDDNSKGA
jgi:chromosome segregation ATPase